MRLAGHYQLGDSRLTEDEQQELENQLSEAAEELDIPFEILPSWHAGYRKCLEVIQEHIKNDIQPGDR